jgi:hypothetical protein
MNKTRIFRTLVFDSREIDQVLWEARAVRDADLIFAKDTTRRGRTWEQVYERCKQGQAAEAWLISQGFTDDPRDYHDLIDPQGNPVEVKVTKWDSRFILERYSEKLRWKNSDWPTTVYVFYNYPPLTTYMLHGIFEWNGKRFFGHRPATLEFTTT